jgi:hypothetical protein
MRWSPTNRLWTPDFSSGVIAVERGALFQVRPSDYDSNPESEGVRKVGGVWIGIASLALAAVQSLCVAAAALSGVRVLLGLTSLLAAGAAGPAHGFHREALRLPMLWIAGLLAALNLLLLWNEDRIRRNPAAQWRLQPLTSRQRRARWIQLVTSVATLLLIVGEVITHTWFHIEH